MFDRATLLNVPLNQHQTPQDVLTCLKSEEEEPKRHPDEHQIQLDTDRSFVMYPVHSKF
jgi:hypothetical protein